MSQHNIHVSEKRIVSRETPKALGRGLDNLLGPTSTQHVVEKKEGLAMLPISVVRPGNYQPRKKFHAGHMSELVESIRENGVLQPILVRPTTEINKFSTPVYEIIAGERRWRASQQAGRKTIPVVIKHLTDKQALEGGLIENIQRDDLNSIEEASGYARLISEFQYTQEALAKMIGKSRSHIANTLRLLTLPQHIRDLLEQYIISAGHGRALINCDRAEEFSEVIVRDNLSVRQTEKMVASYLESPFEPTEFSTQVPSFEQKKKTSLNSSSGVKEEDLLSLEKDLTKALSLKSKIEMKADQSGQVKIHFKTPKDLDKLMNLIFSAL